MTINTDQLLESILDSLDRIDYVKSEDIPDIQLYMDQVTTFMDSHLASTRRCLVLHPGILLFRQNRGEAENRQ